LVNKRRDDRKNKDGAAVGGLGAPDSGSDTTSTSGQGVESGDLTRSVLPHAGVPCGDDANTGTQAPTWAPDAGGGIVTPPPLRIGTYRLLGMLGEGAMGVVYRAEQDRPRREVALKVLKAGTASPAALDRFEQETQVLGRLQHPGIAQIFQAGTADTGYGPQPFFAMEFVHGEPLKDYAETRGLTTRQRLRLLIAVCDGVQHAHQKGVIHRDLKPGNILVDEAGQPKILDFGIALLARDDESSIAPSGEKCQVAGTIPYMSPEQLAGDAGEIDTRSDVYALGVIAYQLLGGRLPFDVRDKTVREAASLVTTQKPIPLGQLVRDCRCDVESIVGKALTVDKSSRYSSASDLAADIHRYFRHEPVLSHPRSGGYLLRKFVRRNRTLVASACLVFVAMAGALWWTNRARSFAEDEADTQRKVTRLALSIVEGIAPELDDDETPASRLQGVLNDAAGKLAEEDFGRRPAVQSALRAALGKVYRSFGDFGNAIFQLDAALKISRASHGPKSPESLQLMQELALALKFDGRIDEAEDLYRQALDMQRATLGAEDKTTIETMQNLALLCEDQGKFDEADALFEEALVAIADLDTVDPELLQGFMSNRAFMLEKRGESDASGKAYQSTLEKFEEVLPENHPQILITKSNLAEHFLRQGEYDRAQELFEQVIDAGRRVLGEDHTITLDAMNSLARVLDKQGRTDEAQRLFERTYDAQRRHLGDDHPKTLVTMHNLASLLIEKGELALAEAMLQRVLEHRQATFGPSHPEVLSTMNSLAALLKRERKLRESAALYKQVIAGYERGDSKDKNTLEMARYNLACVLHDQANVERSAIVYAEAEMAYRQSIAYFRKRLGDEHQTTVTMMFSLAKLLSEKGDFSAAASLHEEVLHVRQRRWPGRVQEIARSQFELGEAYLGLGRIDEAEQMLRECIATRLQEFEARDYRVANAENALGAVLTARGEYDKAEALLLHSLPIIEERYEVSGKRTQTALRRLVSLYRAWNKPAKVAEFASRITPTP